MAPISLDKFKSKPAGHVIRGGKRIEVETLEPKKAPKRRKPFKVRWVKTPTEWIRRLKGKGGAAHELALYILERDFECKQKGGEIILSLSIFIKKKDPVSGKPDARSILRPVNRTRRPVKGTRILWWTRKTGG